MTPFLSILYDLHKFPLSAHDTLQVQTILEDLRELRDREWRESGHTGPSPLQSGLTSAISYFIVMGDAKSEQEHHDAFCTPIIEGS